MWYVHDPNVQWGVFYTIHGWCGEPREGMMSGQCYVPFGLSGVANYKPCLGWEVRGRLGGPAGRKEGLWQRDQTTQVVNLERDRYNIVSIERFDDSFH